MAIHGWGECPPPALHVLAETLRPREAVLLKMLCPSLKTPPHVQGYGHEEFTKYIYEERDHVRDVTMVIPDAEAAHSVYALPCCPNLRTMDLRSATDHVQTFLLQYMSSLETVTLTGFNIRFAGISPLERCADLHLTAAHSLVLDLACVPNLQSLCVHAEGEVSITGSFPPSLQCLVISLHGCMDDRLVEQIADECSSLVHLNLSANRLMYLPGGLLRNMGALKSLTLSGNTFLRRNRDHEDDGMMLGGLMTLHPDASLNVLDVSGNWGIRCDDLSRYMGHVCPRVLDVRGCDQVRAFEQKAACFRKVETLFTSFLPSRQRLHDTFTSLTTIWVHSEYTRVPCPRQAVTASFQSLTTHPCQCFVDMILRPVRSLPKERHTRLVTVDDREVRIVFCDETLRVSDALMLMGYIDS